jgi:hypothetical protein
MLFQVIKQSHQLSIARFVKSMGMGQDSAPLFRSIQQYQILCIVSFAHLPHMQRTNVEHWMHLQIDWIEHHLGLMKPLRDREEVKEVELEETSEEEESGEEDQVDATTVMSKSTWLEIVPTQGSHGALTVEPMGMQLKTAHN